MAATLRRLVSKKKRRFSFGQFDLDLSYITDRIIAMGYPSERLEAMYRNKATDVAKFLDALHRDSYRVYNLCSERRYPPARFFHGRVAEYPFDDHRTPPLALGLRFCADAAAFLDARPQHVVAVHCKAGKGRTGTLVCCLLLWTRLCQSAAEALALFGQRRTTDGKGVTIPSQQRFVRYFEDALRRYDAACRDGSFGAVIDPSLALARILPPPRALVLLNIALHTVPHVDMAGGCEPWVSITHQDVTLFQSRQLKVDRNAAVITINCDEILLVGDIRIDCFHKNSHTKIFSFYFHTSFVKETMTFWKRDLDKACKDKGNKTFESNFRVTVAFREFGAADESKLCVVCKQPVLPRGPTVHSGDRVWHWECCRCSKCGGGLGSKYMFNAANEPICSGCAKTECATFIKFCTACHEVLDTDDIVDALGDHSWHRTCFCCSVCGALLSADSFAHVDTRLFCFDCAPKKGGSTPPASAPTSAPPSPLQRPAKAWSRATPTTSRRAPQPLLQQPERKPPPLSAAAEEEEELTAIPPIPAPQQPRPGDMLCPKCGLPIVASQVLVRAGGKLLHTTCFLCGVCGVELAGAQYFDGPNGDPLCETCHRNSARKALPICAACSVPIEDMSLVIAGDQRYHQSCFKCAACSRLLGEKYAARDGKLYCPECQQQLFSQRCAKCNKPIAAGQYVEVEGRSYHTGCLCCQRCLRELYNTRFFRDPTSGWWLCELCARMNM